MNKSSEINDLILDISEDPSSLDSKFDSLVKLIKESKGSISSDILNDKDLTKLVIEVSNGLNPMNLKDYLTQVFKSLRKSFSEVESESTFGLTIQSDPRNKVTDNERIILFSSPTRDILVNNNTGYVVDKLGPKYSVKVYNTNGDVSSIDNWKFVKKQLATKESLAQLIK